MKLLDVFGTNSESFSIGLGEKKIDFRTFDGVFYFRNFGGGWQKASSELLKDSVRMRTWSPGLTLAEGEIFLYNESIWESKITFETINFLQDSVNLIKVVDLSNFTKLNSNVSPHYLVTEDSDTIYIEGQSGVDVNVFLPDSTTLHVGRKFLFINESNAKVNIFKKETNQYDSINSGESISLILSLNDTIPGTWSKINFGGSVISSNEISDNQLTVNLNLSQYGGVNPFLLGDIVFYNVSNSKWEKAYIGNFDLNILGIVSDKTSNKIYVKFFGEVEFSEPLTYNNVTIVPGTLYYLTDLELIAGKVSSIPSPKEPKKIFIAISTTKILILDLGQSEQKNTSEVLVTLNLTDYDGEVNPFVISDIVYYNTTNSRWEKAYSSKENIGSVGFVTYSDDETIKIAFSGIVELADSLSITPGEYYYLTSDSEDPGLFVSTNEKNEKKLFLSITTKIIILLNEPNENRFNEINYYSINNGSSITINNSTSGLVYKINGYVYNDNNLINFSGLINNGASINAKISTDSPYVFDYDTSPGLCFLEDGTDLTIKNNLGSTKTVVISTEKFFEI